MKKILLFLAAAFLCIPAFADFRITSEITVTNSPTTNGMTAVFNGDTRTWTNNITSSPSTLIMTNNSIGGITTNLYNHLSSARPAGPPVITLTASNKIVLRGQINQAMTISFTGGYATVTNTTNPVVAGTPVVIPVSGEFVAATRTNIGSGLVSAIEDYSTNAISQTSTAASELVGLTNAQTISGAKTVSSGILFQGNITNSILASNSFVFADSNSVLKASNAPSSYLTTVLNDETGSGPIVCSNAPTIRNPIIIGGATITNSGSTARLTWTNSTHTGNNGKMFMDFRDDQFYFLNYDSVELARLTMDGDWTFGGDASMANALIDNLGVEGAADFTNSVTMRGEVIFPKTNIVSLVNGVNYDIVTAGKSWLILSGMSSNFSTDSFAGGSDGREIVVTSPTTNPWTITHMAGAPTAANRIWCPNAASVTITNSTAAFRYNGTSNLWILISFAGNATAGITAGSSLGGSFPIYFSTSGSTLQFRGLESGLNVNLTSNGTTVTVGTTTNIQATNLTTRILTNDTSSVFSGSVKITNGATEGYALVSDSAGTATWTANTAPIFVKTNSTIVSNTVTETSLVGSGVGSTNIAANRLTDGTVLRIKASGIFTNTAETFTFRVKFGTTTLASGAFAVFPVTAGYWEINATVTVRTAGASGAVIAGGTGINSAPDSTYTETFPVFKVTETTVDTTAAQGIHITVQHDSAVSGTTVVCQQMIVETLR